MYIANHYTRVNGKLYKKGEDIPENVSQERIDWLLEAGAIKKAAVSASRAETKKDIEPEKLTFPEDEPETERPELEALEEADGEEDAPEIDVMAGIVQDEKPEPKKTTRKKSEGRKAK